MILIKKILNLLKIKNKKTSLTNLKFSKGDKVIIKIYDRKPSGIVKDVRIERLEKYKVSFASDRGGDIWYWFNDEELELDKQFYRSRRLSKLGI